MNKLKVIITGQSPYAEWKVGCKGFIDGYIRGADGVPYAIVVVKDSLLMVPLTSLKVIV
jgi:hypothetical protein